MRRLLFRNFAAVYRASRWFTVRFTPAGRLLGAGLVASGIFGVDLSKSYAFQLFGLGLALGVVGLVGGLASRPRCRVLRRLPRFATAGETLRYRIEVTNERRRRQAGLVLREDPRIRFPSFAEFSAVTEPGARSRNRFDRYVGYHRWAAMIRERIGFVSPAHALAPVAAGATVSTELALTPTRRGVLRLSRLRVSRCDPLGLINSGQRTGEPGSILVLPKTYPLPRLRPFTSPANRSMGADDPRSLHGTAAFRSIREYQPGDSLRHIDWRGFARRGRLMVKEFHDERHGAVAIYLDTRIDAGLDGRLDRGQFECAVSVAGSLMRALAAVQDCELLMAGNRGAGMRSACSTEQALAQLAAVQPRPREAQLEAAALARHIQAESALLVLLGWDLTRQDLARRLARRMAGAVSALVVAEALPSPARAHGLCVDVIRPSRGQHDLVRFCRDRAAGVRQVA